MVQTIGFIQMTPTGHKNIPYGILIFYLEYFAALRKNGTNLFFTHVILYMAIQIALHSQSKSGVNIGGIPSSEEA